MVIKTAFFESVTAACKASKADESFHAVAETPSQTACAPHKLSSNNTSMRVYTVPKITPISAQKPSLSTGWHGCNAWYTNVRFLCQTNVLKNQTNTVASVSSVICSGFFAESLGFLGQCAVCALFIVQ